jgi:hypothetical protein
VLPVIVHSLLARPGTLVIIEQPELHLHPSAQARLADLFIDVILSIIEIEDKPGEIEQKLESRGVNILIETHSEHLLLRLQRRLGEATLETKKADHFAHSPIYQFPLFLKDFVAYFVERPFQAIASECKAIHFNDWGEYIEQPAGFVEFFGDSFTESLGISKARTEWKEIEDDFVV